MSGPIVNIKLQKKNSEQLSDVNDAAPTPKVTEGGLIFEKMLTNPSEKVVGFETYLSNTLVSLAVPGLVFVILNFFGGFCCCCSRCCCAGKCTCFQASTTKQYNILFRNAPMALYGVLAFIIVVFGIVGITSGSGAFANSFIRGACTVDTVNVRINGFIDSILKPVTQLNTQFGRVANTVTNSLGDTSPILDSMATMETRWNQLRTQADTYKDHSNNFGDCSMRFTGVAYAAEEAQKATGAAADELETSLNDVKNSVQKNLLDAQIEIAAATQSSQDSADEMKSNVDSALEETSKIAIDIAKQVSEHADKIAAGPFAWIFLVPIFAVVGFLTMKMNSNVEVWEAGQSKKNPRLQGKVNKLGKLGGMGSRSVVCAWSMTFFFGVVSCLLAAIFMPVAQLYTDACYGIHDFPIKMAPPPSPSSTDDDASPDIIGGCWKDQSIFDILGLADSMTFVDISFDGVDETVDLKGEKYDEVGKEIESIPSNCVGASDVKEDWDRVGIAVEATEDFILSYQDNLKNIQSDQVNVLTDLVDDIKNSGSCGFLRTTWEETYEILCVDASNALTTLGSMCLMVGIFGFFSAFFLLWTNQTNGGHGPTKASDDTKVLDKSQELVHVVAHPVGRTNGQEGNI